MTNSRKVVLVTGGAGYIGSHACKALSEQGHVPVVYDNLGTGHEWAVRWGPLEVGDLRDRARLDGVLEAYSPDAVMHFAAHAHVGESVRDPGKYYDNNVAGSLTLLEAMRDHGLGRLVFSSTCATYGIPDRVPITEDTRQDPINPYGASKQMVERMLQDFGAAHGVGSVALRYFNAAGADPDADIGEDHDPETHLIPLALDAAAGRRPDITVFGTDYDTPDGTCIRDYIHVSDLAEAHIRALDVPLQKGEPIAFNLGVGRGHSVREVIETVHRITGRAVPVVDGPRRPGDPAWLVCNAEKAAQVLGWQPCHTDLPIMVETAWTWHRNHREHRETAA